MIDPLHTTSFEFTDFGSWYSPDGREHPVTGQTPFAPLEPLRSIADLSPDATEPATTLVQNASIGSDIVDKILARFLPEHIGARVIIGVIAVILLAVVAVRLTKI